MKMMRIIYVLGLLWLALIAWIVCEDAANAAPLPTSFICPYHELASYDENAASAYVGGDVSRSLLILEGEINGWLGCVAHEADPTERVNLRLIVAITQFQQAVVSARSSDKPKAEEYGARALRGARALLQYHDILTESPSLAEKINSTIERMLNSAKVEGFSVVSET